MKRWSGSCERRQGGGSRGFDDSELHRFRAGDCWIMMRPWIEGRSVGGVNAGLWGGSVKARLPREPVGSPLASSCPELSVSFSLSCGLVI